MFQNANYTNNESSTQHSYQPSVKGKLNIREEGLVKLNKMGGEIISVLPNIPIEAYLDDLLFIITIPNVGQDRAPVYIRLQDRDRTVDRSEVQQFSEIHTTGYLKQKTGQFIVCAVDTHVKVKLSQLVIIATIPTDGKMKAPCYIKPRTPKSGMIAKVKPESFNIRSESPTLESDDFEIEDDDSGLTS